MWYDIQSKKSKCWEVNLVIPLFSRVSFLLHLLGKM